MMLREPIIIATEADGSGMGRFAVELANALAAAGHPVTMVARAQPYPLHVAREIVAPSLGASHGWRKTLGLARQSLRIAAAVWRHASPAAPLLMIHIAATLPVSLAPIVAARLKRARVVLSLHDFYPHTLRFPQALHGLERWLYRAAYRRCDLVVTNNAAQSRRLIAEAQVPARRVRTLFHGPFVIAGLERGDGAGDLRLLIFGSLRPNKRVLEAIRAVRQLRDVGAAVSLRIAGAPRREDAAYWGRCLAEIAPGDPGFDLHARFIADAQLPGVLAGVDAMLCPYAGFDSQSGVAVIGVSNAVPVIATAAARVIDGGLGAPPWPPVADRADAAAIAQAVRGFIAIPAGGRQAYADALKARFMAMAGWNTLAANYVQAMHEVEVWR